MNVEVRGSKNDFVFGPVTIDIPIDIPYREQPQAVLDAILQSDDTDGIDTLKPAVEPTPLRQPTRTAEQTLQSVSQRAARHGFTALSYIRGDGKDIRIL